MTSSIQATIWCDNKPDGKNQCPQWFQADGKPHGVRREARLKGWQQTRVDGRHKGSRMLDLCPKCAVTYWVGVHVTLDFVEAPS